MARRRSKLKVINSHVSKTEPEIAYLEVRLKITLPEEYRQFLLLHNGGMPLQDTFQFKNETGPYTDSCVNRFFAVYGDEYDDLERTFLFCQSEGLIADNLLPVADDPGGNMICLSISGPDTNAVYFWDHEAIDENDKSANLHLIADSFEEFLASLRKSPQYVEPEFDRVSRENDLEGLKTLIASGWNVNTVHFGRQQTPIETSATYAKIEFIQVLLDHGAKLGRSIEIIERCLAMPHLAAFYDYEGALTVLTDHVNATR